MVVLNKWIDLVDIDIFLEVELNLLIDIVYKGVVWMKVFKLDIIIVFGGGFVMDVVKGMWFFYEYLEVFFLGVK